MDDQIVIKENEVFLVSDGRGDVSAHAGDGQGLYYHDTRFLSLYQLAVEEFEPVVLATAGELNFLTTLQLANSPTVLPDGQPLRARTISVRRNRFLQDGLHERIGFFNYNPFPVTATVRLSFAADFRDMFEVRGYHRRTEHGTFGTPTLHGDELLLPYVGLDGVERCTRIRFGQPPIGLEIVEPDAQLAGPMPTPEFGEEVGEPRTESVVLPSIACALFELALPPRGAAALSVHIRPLLGEDAASPTLAVANVTPAPSLDEAYQAIRESYRLWTEECTAITTDNDVVNHLLAKSQSDLRLLMNQLPTGLLPMAGIPWFSVPFGRDSLITAYATLMLNPGIAYGTLRFLAQHQGREVNDWRDEEPGKILHEIRMGELATSGAVPFGPYYGSIDSTPLFLIVLGELVRWTGDWAFAATLRPAVERALEWIDRYGDVDGDGYVEYRSRSERGIANQGWKDSFDSVCHRDGSLAAPPIALCEVQGYVYAARLLAAELFAGWGEPARAAALREQAAALRAQFERDFWLENEGYYAMALDGAKRPVPSVGSNGGQVLWSGIAAPERAARVAERLLAADLLCGWGIRTLSSEEPTFNPMSYHNGSVWPHDNALVAAGLQRYGQERGALEVASQVYEAGVRFPSYRIPELYCGFVRDRHYQSLPADYPVSCRPQAWAAASIFLLLQQTLGLTTDPANHRVVLRPRLLPGVQTVRLRGLRVLGSSLDLEVRGHDGRVHVEVHSDNAPQVLVQRGEVAVSV
ncbi:MAG TPA: glycogen debranching N-terminal domain-containing protein [Chloroflexota bacterium]|nr:glycogen debranching N-terminal domain-containing protein [Chloroflexota bacterium]